MFTLLTYRVEADYRPGLFANIKAESYWDALVLASQLWDIPVNKLTASIEYVL